jgi:hypothetical protein
MTELSKKLQKNIANLVKKQFYEEAKTGSGKEVFRKLSLLYHPDKCLIKELPIGLTFEEAADQWDWEPSKELKKLICEALFKNLSEVYQEFQRLEKTKGTGADEDEEEPFILTKRTEGDKTFWGYGIYSDKTGIHYEGEWKCPMCGVINNPLYRPEECARCGFNRNVDPHPDAVKATKVEKKAAASKEKFKKSRDHFNDFKKFMKETHDINITKNNFDKYFDDPEYLTEYRDPIGLGADE